jgi:hypothetical protein
MAKGKPMRPSETAQRSGQCREMGPRSGKGREVTVPKGHTLPPTTGKSQSYKLVDPTKNKAGLGE